MLEKSHRRQFGKKKNIFTKVLHHGHMSHWWWKEAWGNKRWLCMGIKSLLSAGFGLPFRDDTDVENKGHALFYMHLENHSKIKAGRDPWAGWDSSWSPKDRGISRTDANKQNQHKHGCQVLFILLIYRVLSLKKKSQITVQAKYRLS